jgi:predicted alpha/beta superfamily hydrolase
MKPNHKLIFSVLFLLCIIAKAQQVSKTLPPSAGVAEGTPVTIPEARQYDITSRINGQTYRIMVYAPLNANTQTTFPTLYVLDGNYRFGPAALALRQFSKGLLVPGIVVGIGYPTDDLDEIYRRRTFDMTPSVSNDPARVDSTGGGDAFLRVIEEEIKPFVKERYNVNPAQQFIYGSSLGGLIVLRALYRNPKAFSTYILSSPSIWWNDKEILADEEAFSKRARSGELHLKVLVTSAGDESNSMVDNASEFAERLSSFHPQNITVVRTIFDGEIHISVGTASLIRAIRFAFPLPIPAVNPVNLPAPSGQSPAVNKQTP